MHGRHILHRDIKPENVLIKKSKSDGTVRAQLADFGISCHITQENLKSVYGILVGTPGFIDPHILSVYLNKSKSLCSNVS